MHVVYRALSRFFHWLSHVSGLPRADCVVCHPEILDEAD